MLDIKFDAKAFEAAQAKKKADAKAKLDAEAAAKKKAEGEYQAKLDAADQETVSGRIMKQAGMEGRTDAMTQDILKGAKFGEAVLGPDGLGRLGESETLQAMEAQAAELAKGYSSEEMLARRERAKEGIAGTTEAQSRAAQAALARSGVKGMQAGMQLAGIRQSGIEATADMERDLMIQNRQAQMEGLGMQQGLYRDRTDRQQFDLSQAAKEKDIALQSGLGFAQMGEARRAAEFKAARAGRQRSCFIAGTKIEMKDGSFKNIEDIQLGDETKGGIVYSTHTGLTDTIYNYNGIFVSGMHAVCEDRVWKRVHKTDAKKLEDGIFKVYNLGTTDHRIYIDGVEFADFDETSYGSQISDAASLEELNYGTLRGIHQDRGGL
jgi:hypothetical protein